MKKTLAIILLSILTLSVLLCSCDLGSHKEEEDPIIKKVEIRQDDNNVTVVYEDGYELTYPLAQPIDVFVEKDNTHSARAIGISIFYFTSIGGGNITIAPGDTATNVDEYVAQGNGSGNFVVSGDSFTGIASGVQVQMKDNYLEYNGKKYENCATELLTIFRTNTTLIDFATGYEKEPFAKIYSGGFTNFEKLEAVILPTSIKKVDKRAFDGCSKLTTVYYYGTAEEWDLVELVGTETTDKEDKEKVESIPNLLESCTVYFYSEQAPTAAGNYWHMVDGKPVAW